MSNCQLHVVPFSATLFGMNDDTKWIVFDRKMLMYQDCRIPARHVGTSFFWFPLNHLKEQMKVIG